MFKKILPILLVCLITAPIFGLATSWNIYERPTAMWWTGARQGQDVGWEWMKAIDELMASVGNNTATGRAYYVDSNVSNEGDGTSWTNARDTLDEAINLCTADNGDIIYIAPGHTETMGAAADEVDVDVDGVRIFGIGTGDSRPLFDYTGDVGGAFAIGADAVTIANVRFKANTPDVNDAIEVEAGSEHLSVVGCWFGMETAGTDEFHETINADTAGNHYLRVVGCEFAMGAGAARCAIEFRDSDYAIITDNVFAGDYAVADINNATTASDHIVIKDNVIFNGTIGGAAGLNAQPGIELKTDTSGVIVNNHIFCNVATPDAAVVGADMYLTGNWYNETEGGVSAAPMWWTTDTADNLIGFDDSNNSAATTNVGENDDGSILERLEALQNMTTDALARLGQAGIDVGDVFYVDSVTGSGSGTAVTWADAEATIDGAIDLCTANVGDTIIVAPGHAETVSSADGFDADTAGITIIGLGRGTDMPVITMDNANGECVVGADNVVIMNLRFEATVTGVLIGLDIEANSDYTLVKDCVFTDAGDNIGTDEFVDTITVGDACIGTRIEGCRIQMRAAGAAGGIVFSNDTDQTEIVDNIIQGDFSVACIDGENAAAASTNMLIKNNILVNGSLVGDGGLNDQPAISLLDATGGLIIDNRIASDVATHLLMVVADDMVCIANYSTDDDGDEFEGGLRGGTAAVTTSADG